MFEPDSNELKCHLLLSSSVLSCALNSVLCQSQSCYSKEINKTHFGYVHIYNIFYITSSMSIPYFCFSSPCNTLLFR